ncbi:hypothetical protein V6N12_069047 [Hibiscus sabdariffa]|uniref:Uncharacterized protein n=1 Tax=Hibiscus sabdariffa TaxID=183260 RepID=A0ABR2FCQ0_9ROSI
MVKEYGTDGCRDWRVSVLSAVEDAGLGSGNAKDGATDSLSLLSDPVVPGKGGLLIEVPVVHVGANGVRMASDGVALREVNTNTQDTVQVISSGGGLAPQVVSHVVQNVVGSHAAVSILDAANE